jgi:hypothetical protein
LKNPGAPLRDFFDIRHFAIPGLAKPEPGIQGRICGIFLAWIPNSSLRSLNGDRKGLTT